MFGCRKTCCRRQLTDEAVRGYHESVDKLLRGLVAGTLLLGVAGCASWGTHEDSVVACERGFANDPDWSRAQRAGLKGRTVLRRYPTFEFEGRTSRPLKPSTVWFRNHVSREIASCSMHSCETGRCVWRIRLYAPEARHWIVRSEYDIAKPGKISGR